MSGGFSLRDLLEKPDDLLVVTVVLVSPLSVVTGRFEDVSLD